MSNLRPVRTNGAARDAAVHPNELGALADKWSAEAERLRALEPYGQAAGLEEAARDLRLAIALRKLTPPAAREPVETPSDRVRATELYDMGYEDLVSLVPTNTHMITRDSIILDGRGKTPGRRSRGRWFTYDWDRRHGRDLAEEIDETGANIGLRARNFPGLNLNADEPDVTLAVLDVARDVLGPAPHRMSRMSRRLLLYRTDRPFRGRSAAIAYKGKAHTVELLGDGQQYVLFGRHQSGSQYTWSRLWPPSELTQITEADADRFFEQLKERLEGRGFSVEHHAVRKHFRTPEVTAGPAKQAPFFAESGTSPPDGDGSTDLSGETGKEGSHA